MFLEEMSYHLTPIQREIVTMVVQDPTLIKPSGKINVKRVAEALDLTWFESDKQIKGIGEVMENDL
jgi:hypothetical protein